MLIGCSGGSSTPPTPPILEVQPLNLSFVGKSFEVGGSRKVFVVDGTVFATDINNQLFRLSHSSTWEKLEQSLTELVSLNGVLIANSGSRSFDNGSTWDISTPEELSNLTLNNEKVELYANSKNSLLVSKGEGDSWTVFASFEQTVFDFIKISESEFLIALSGNERFIAKHNIDSNTTEFITPENKIFTLFLEESGRIIGTGSSDVFFSKDNATTWEKFKHPLGEQFSHLALGIESVNGETITVGSQNIKKISDDDILEMISFEQPIGKINSIGATSDKVYLSAPSGFFSADAVALKQKNEVKNIQTIGLPTEQVDLLLSSPLGDFYLLDINDSALLYSLDSELQIFVGNKSITSIYNQVADELFMTYSSNTENGFGGVGYYNFLTNEFTSLLEGFSVQRAVSFSNSTYVHYTNTATSKQPFGLLRSSGGDLWDSFSLPGGVDAVLSISFGGACGEFNILGRNSQGVSVFSRFENNPTAPWQSILEAENALSMKSSDAVNVVWDENSFWIRNICSENYERIELEGNISGNISDLILEGNIVWFATDLGELWKFEDNTLFKQVLGDFAIEQVFISSDNNVHVITAERVSSAMIN